MVAFAKLQEVVISGKPITFGFQKVANFGALAVALALIAIVGVAAFGWLSFSAETYMSAWNVSGVTNCCAPAVITTWTSNPRATSRRTTSSWW